MTLPPGRAGLAMSALIAKLPPPPTTMGIVLVALWAMMAVVKFGTTMTSTGADHLGNQGGKPIEIPLRPAPLNGEVVALRPAAFAQPLPERIEKGRGLRRSRREVQPEKSDPGDMRWPLRGSYQWEHEGRENEHHSQKPAVPRTT